jgi:glyoxylase-like metal-dependent hydrolase (beta-lactamase superfamily II)
VNTVKIKLALVLTIVWYITTAASAPEEMRPVKIADGVYMFESSRGASNATVVLTDEGVLVFDFNILTADQVLAGIRKLTDKKFRYLISSHSALDHASGAWYFRDDKPVYIATKTQMHDLQMQELAGFNERRDSKDPRNAPYQGKTLVQPDIAFDGNMTLYFGGLTFQITAEGRGHSTGDLTVYIPQKRVFLMGDLLDTEVHPGQGESGDIFFSNVKGWIEILDRIMARHLPVETYVPGHGPVHVGRGVKDLEEQKRYFVVMRDEVAKLVAAGKSLAQIEKEIKVPQEFAHYKRLDRLPPFIKLYYHQLMESGY